MPKENEHRIKLYKVPETIIIHDEEERLIETSNGTYRLLFPVLTDAMVQQVTDSIQASRDHYLYQLSIHDIVDKVDQAVQKWLDPTYSLRKLAECLLPVITGYDSETIRLELKRYMRNFRKKELLRFLDEELDQATILDGFRPRKSGGLSMAVGPRLIFHVFSGNVPGVPIWSLIMGLLCKSASLGKTSSAEPLLPILFCQTLSEVDERLAEAIAILPWKGGTEDLERPAIQAAEAIVVYGSNRTVEALRPKVPFHKRFLTYGHKVSFAMIGKEALTSDHYYKTLHDLAEDVILYDQQSCLSPQCVIVESGGEVSPKQVAQLLASELDRYQVKRPRAVLMTEEMMAIQRLRHHYTFEAMKTPEKIAVYQSADTTAWTVIFHQETGFDGSPLNRTIHVFATDHLEEALPVLAPYSTVLQSCGLAISPERLFSMGKQLGHYGVDRLTAIGQMTRSKPGWHHDGGFNLLSLLRFVDIERSLEERADLYDPDME